MKRFLLSCLVLVITTLTYGQSSQIFVTDEGAIKGYDAVAFFKEQKPVKGLKEFSHEWSGAVWYFASAENREAFKAEPDRYAPQYGGYCAYGTAGGHKAPTETDTWTIVNDKLYFNYNKKVQTAWKKDQKALIEKADKNWPQIKDQQ